MLYQASEMLVRHKTTLINALGAQLTEMGVIDRLGAMGDCLFERKPAKVAAVTLANKKITRIVWVLMTKQTSFRPATS